MQYNPVAQEFNPRPSNAGGSEFQGAPEAPSPAPSAKKKKPLQLKLTSFLVSATAVAVVGGTAIAPMFSPEASITSLSATDTQIAYSVEVEEGAQGLMLVAYNDFTRREVALTEGVNEGTFEGLKPQMRYTVAVEASGLGGTLAEERVTTLSAEEAPVTALYAVSHECTCNVDGCFHFTMDFVDGRGIWSDFSATLTDKNGTVSECVFSEDLAQEQSIDVIGAPLVGREAQFVITCLDAAQGVRVTLYSATVKI